MTYPQGGILSIRRPKTVPVHQLAACWAWMERPGVVGFQVRGSQPIWEEAEYPEHPPAGKGGLVRVYYLKASLRGIRAVTRYLDPDEQVTGFWMRDPDTGALGLVDLPEDL